MSECKALAALLLCSFAYADLQTVAGAADVPEFPPLSPEGETSAPDDRDFPKACLKDLNLIVQRVGWRYGASFLSHSEKWGDIWRIDFEIAGEDLSPRINRVMCWRTPADAKLNLMIAIGQDILPLERAPGSSPSPR